MNIINVEYAIIGAGTAGLGAYSKISRQTSSLVMVQDGPYGTTCARVGCMPSKLLITAQVLEMPIYHPSAEELLRDVLQNAEKQRLALISSLEFHQLRQA